MDIFTKAFKDTKTTALTLGVSTVIITHIAIFTLPDPLDKGAKSSHAAINLAAAGAIIWGAGILG